MSIRFIATGGAAASGPSYDAAATAYFAAVVTAGGSLSNADKTIYNTLFAGLRTDGTLSKFDRLLMAAPTATPTLLDLISLTAYTPISSPTFTASQGYAGNGTSSYVDTNYTPSSSAVQFTLNSGTYGIYIRTNRTLGQDKVILGARAGARTQFWPKYSDDNIYADCSSNNETAIANAGSVQGMWVVSRTASNLVTVYKNGSSFGTSADASTSLSTNSVFLGANHNPGDFGDSFSDDQFAAAFLSAGLNATEAANVTTRINAFLTSYGTNVY